MDHPYPTNHEVIAAIRAAFASVDRGTGVTLHEAEVIDMYGSAEERAEARLLDTDEVWEAVRSKDIENSDSALLFLDAMGFRYYIPAFMIWTLEHEYSGSYAIHSTLFRLTTLDRPEELQSGLLWSLDDDQRKAVALFLLYFSPTDFDVSSAVRRFWKKYLPREFLGDFQ